MSFALDFPVSSNPRKRAQGPLPPVSSKSPSRCGRAGRCPDPKGYPQVLLRGNLILLIYKVILFLALLNKSSLGSFFIFLGQIQRKSKMPMKPVSREPPRQGGLPREGGIALFFFGA